MAAGLYTLDAIWTIHARCNLDYSHDCSAGGQTALKITHAELHLKLKLIHVSTSRMAPTHGADNVVKVNGMLA